MPAEEADIHGIERHPVAHTEQSDNHCPPNSSEDVREDPSTDQPGSPGKQGTTPQVVITSSVKDGCPPLADSVGIGEDVGDTSNTTSVADSA